MHHHRSSETWNECCISTCSNWIGFDILFDIYSLHCRPHHDMWYRARVSIQRIKEWKNTMSINKGSRQVIIQADQVDKIDSSGSVCIHLFYQCSRSFLYLLPSLFGLCRPALYCPALALSIKLGTLYSIYMPPTSPLWPTNSWLRCYYEWNNRGTLLYLSKG